MIQHTNQPCQRFHAIRHGAIAWSFLVATFFSTLGAPLEAEEHQQATAAARKAWTTSKVQGRPEPPLPFVPRVAFPNLELDRPVTLTNAPGTERLFVVQIAGQIVSFVPGPDVGVFDEFINLRELHPDITNVYGMTFHPEYPVQPYVYISYVLKNKDPQGTVVSRFTVDAKEPPRADPASERTLIRWLAGGHNGACLKFGPDGFLYISAGDGTGPNPPDILRAGQDITNLLSTIMRVDVDRTESGRNYAIPPSNPFLERPEARPEIYAFGFRNPWKFSFDRKTGDLWAGDVGWDLWELVFRVQRGGNYGWSIVEGSNPIHPTDVPGPGPIIPPVVEHHHSEARSITGGFVYHGKRHPSLVGSYVYGDYNTGKIWALRFEDGKVQELREIANSPNQIIGWCETNDGELYYADYQRTNLIYELAVNTSRDQSASFPRTLSATGLFESTESYQLQPGIASYQVNAALWEDDLRAIRHLAIPGNAQIQVTAQKQWRFPENSVVVRTLTRDIGGESTRLETQIMHLHQNEWRPYSYIWNQEQTDATLVPEGGVTQSFGAYQHRVASRVECRICHSKLIGGLLGVRAEQLKSMQHKSLTTWKDQGLFDQPAIATTGGATLVDPYDNNESLDARARSYLHVNCVTCHRPGGGGPSPIHLDFNIPIEQTKLINQSPIQGDFQIPGAKIVSPGDPMQSILFYRMAKMGPGHMPHIGARQIDPKGLRLMHEWISRMSKTTIDETTSDEVIHEMLQTPSGTLQLAWALHDDRFGKDWQDRVILLALTERAPHVRDLLEPFYPESQKKNRLGIGFDHQQVLGLTGDPRRGETVFRNEALQCVSCHAVSDRGGELGPPLDKLATKYKTNAELLKSITDPSTKIDPAYQMLVVLTNDGENISGRVVAENEDTMELITAERKRRVIRLDSIQAAMPSDNSLMPQQLLQSLSPQEAADLLAYLLSL